MVKRATSMRLAKLFQENPLETAQYAKCRHSCERPLFTCTRDSSRSAALNARLEMKSF